METLGHVPSSPEGKWCKCCICGSTWNVSKRYSMQKFGPCPGPSMWDQAEVDPNRPVWRLPHGANPIWNGREINPTHQLAWTCNTLFCFKCGAYAHTRCMLLTRTCRMKVKDAATASHLKSMKRGIISQPARETALQIMSDAPTLVGRPTGPR